MQTGRRERTEGDHTREQSVPECGPERTTPPKCYSEYSRSSPIVVTTPTGSRSLHSVNATPASPKGACSLAVHSRRSRRTRASPRDCSPCEGIIRRTPSNTCNGANVPPAPNHVQAQTRSDGEGEYMAVPRRRGRSYGRRRRQPLAGRPVSGYAFPARR